MYLFRHLIHIYLPAMLTDASLPSLGQAKATGAHSEMLPGNIQNSRWIEIFSIFSQYLDVSGISFERFRTRFPGLKWLKVSLIDL